MRLAVVIAHGRPSGGVRRMIKFGLSLEARGNQVAFLYIGGDPRPDIHGLTPISFPSLADAAGSLDALICPGDLPLWRIAAGFPETCRLIALYLHFGVHSPLDETSNACSPLIEQAATPRWICAELEQLGNRCTWIGPGPLDEDLHEVAADRALRIGTLVHAGYGWKNSAAVATAYHSIAASMKGVELWSYGSEHVTGFPGRFFYRPDLAERRLIYSSCRAWVVPSIFEGLGMTGFDAMQCGTPVVSCDNAGIREYADEATCLIVRPSRPDELEAAIRRLLADRDFGSQLAARAMERISDFPWSRCVDRLEALLDCPDLPHRSVA